MTEAENRDAELAARIEASLHANAYDEALRLTMDRAMHRALSAFAEAGVRFTEGPDIQEADTIQILSATLVSAKSEIERLKDHPNIMQLEYATNIIGAVLLLYSNLERPDLSTITPQDRLARLILLGGYLAQTDFELAGRFDSVWEDVQTRKRHKAGRQKGQRKQAEQRIAWHEPALEIATRLCDQRPTITSREIADQIAEKVAGCPSSAQALDLVGKARRDGRLPRKEPKGRKP